MEQRNYWQQRLSRRRALAGTVLAGAGLAATIIGCGEKAPAPASPTGAEVKQPKRGGTLNYFPTQGGIWTDGVDPHVLRPTATGRMRLFYQALLRENPRTFELEPELAQRWEQPSETEYLLRLQPGVKWHNKPPANGRELTVDDVLFSLDRIRTNEPRFQNRLALSSVEKIEAPDRATIKVTTKGPDVTILRALAGFSMVVLAPEVVEKAGGKFTTAETVVGTGAFILQQFDDVSSLQVRNPDYWKPGLPYLDAVRLVHFRDDQALWSAFLTGQMHLAQVPGAQAKKVAEDPTKKYSVEWFPDVGFQGLYVNIQRPPFDDPRLPRALRLLVDHEEAIKAHTEVWHGRGRITSILPAAFADWDYSEEEYISRFLEYKRPKDEAVREALRLLNAAGFSRDNPLSFQITGYTLGGWYSAQQELLQAQFNRLSQGVIQARLRPLESAALNSAMSRGDFEVSLSGMSAPFPEVDSYIRALYYPGGSRNYGRYHDPNLVQMIDRQRTLFDVAQRKAAVKEIIQYSIENAAPYKSWAGRYILNAHQPTVKDWAPEGELHAWGFQYEHVWLEA